MNILINCSNLAAGGGIQVAHSFINEIRNEKCKQFHVVLSKGAGEQINNQGFPENFFFYSHNLKPNLFRALYGRDQFLDNLCGQKGIDVVFTIFGPSYWKPKVPHLIGFARAKYVYKESPYFSGMTLKSMVKLFFKEKLDMRNFRLFSNALVTESWDVSKRIKSIMPQKEVFTVTNSYNQVFENLAEGNINSMLPYFDGITILTVSSYYYHKNFEIIPPTIKYLKKSYPDFKFRFALTIHESDFPFSIEDIKEHIIFIGKVPIEKCPGLYLISDIAFQPSFLECFSAMYPEAMKMKVPLLVSDLDFARGICGDAAHYFDPISARNAGEAIFELANNAKLREKLISSGKKRLVMFDTPQSRAKKYLEIINGLKKH